MSLLEHDRETFVVYWHSKEAYERYSATADNYVRVHGRKTKPQLTHILHILDGEVIEYKKVC